RLMILHNAGCSTTDNRTARDGYDNTSRIGLDGNRMIWTWNFDLLCFHALFFFCSALQELRDMLNKELRVLVVRAVIGVGVDDQQRIRHVLLHDERVHRGYVHVVTAVHDECWLLDRLQIVGGPLLLDAPLANRFDLGGRHLVVHLGIAALLPTMRALQELPSRRLSRR